MNCEVLTKTESVMQHHGLTHVGINSNPAKTGTCIEIKNYGKFIEVWVCFFLKSLNEVFQQMEYFLSKCRSSLYIKDFNLKSGHFHSM